MKDESFLHIAFVCLTDNRRRQEIFKRKRIIEVSRSIPMKIVQVLLHPFLEKTLKHILFIAPPESSKPVKLLFIELHAL